jgi:uncharacterized protein (DUF2132 family)
MLFLQKLVIHPFDSHLDPWSRDQISAIWLAVKIRMRRENPAEETIMKVDRSSTMLHLIPKAKKINKKVQSAKKYL